jgi:hypothetical protein
MLLPPSIRVAIARSTSSQGLIFHTDSPLKVLHMLIDPIQENSEYNKFNMLIAVLIGEMKLTSANRNMKRRLTYLGVY